jgi:hypothetical protein
VDFVVVGGMLGFTLIYEENGVGEICFGGFLGFCSGSRVGLVRRGGTCVFKGVLV